MKLLLVLSIVVCLAPFCAEAQPSGRIARIGLLSPEPLPGERDVIFLKRLSELGWTEGKNILIERRQSALRFRNRCSCAPTG